MTHISREQSAVGGTASDSPVMQGRNARENGHVRDSCPYPEGSPERQGWLEGYDNITADALEGGPTPRTA
jgi:ribosome modulation factor